MGGGGQYIGGPPIFYSGRTPPTFAAPLCITHPRVTSPPNNRRRHVTVKKLFRSDVLDLKYDAVAVQRRVVQHDTVHTRVVVVLLLSIRRPVT